MDEMLHPPKKLLCNPAMVTVHVLGVRPGVQCCTEHTSTVLRKSSLLAGVLKCTTALAGGRLVNALPGTRIGQADGTISPPWASFKCPREEHSMASRTWPRRGAVCRGFSLAASSSERLLAGPSRCEGDPPPALARPYSVSPARQPPGRHQRPTQWLGAGQSQSQSQPEACMHCAINSASRLQHGAERPVAPSRELLDRPRGSIISESAGKGAESSGLRSDGAHCVHGQVDGAMYF